MAEHPDYHLGHMLLDQMLKRPDALCQIDAGTGKSETNASVVSRSIRLARCLRRFGAVPGDLLALHGKNHLDLLIPFYAALFNGLTVFGVDTLYKFEEIKFVFDLTKPKVAFCQCEHLLDAVTELGLDTKVVTFDEGKLSMKNFLKEYGEEDEEDFDEEFRPAEFNTDKVYAFLVSTSGTTGLPKMTAHKHKPWIEKLKRMDFKKMFKDENSKHNRPALNVAPMQWISAFFNVISMPLMNQCIVQTSLQPTAEHIIEIINEYKPVQALFSPYRLNHLLKHEKECDFTCFDVIRIAGAGVDSEIIYDLRKRIRSDAVVLEIFAITETLGQVFATNPDGPVGSCGKPGEFQVKLIDPDTEVEISEPNKSGQLLIKGCAMFTEYYNNPEATAAAFTNDGWYKSGDLFYRDADNNYFFVERIGMLIKYRSYYIAPMELASVIRQHPGVLDVSVTFIPHHLDAELPVACVVRRPGHNVTAHEIKELVANKLHYHKRLRGGVIFMNKLPRTSTGKEARAKLKQIALIGHRE